MTPLALTIFVLVLPAVSGVLSAVGIDGRGVWEGDEPPALPFFTSSEKAFFQQGPSAAVSYKSGDTNMVLVVGCDPSKSVSPVATLDLTQPQNAWAWTVSYNIIPSSLGYNGGVGSSVLLGDDLHVTGGKDCTAKNSDAPNSEILLGNHFVIHFPDLVVRALPDLIHPRYAHTTVFVDHYLFIIGGQADKYAAFSMACARIVTFTWITDMRAWKHLI